MRVKELIAKLEQVKGENRVYLFNSKDLPVDFTGISFDDIGEVSLYIIEGDEVV